MPADYGESLRQRLNGKRGVDLVNELFAFMNERGHSHYDEAVTQLQHALQCAEFAQQREFPDTAVTAALLHDLGHLLMDEQEAQKAFLAEDLNHEEIGAELLREFFPKDVTEPIRLHVAAKRYLCTTDETYYNRLSEASKRSFVVQGGAMSADERQAMDCSPYLEVSLALRELDEEGKIPEHNSPTLDSFAACVVRCLLDDVS